MSAEVSRIFSLFLFFHVFSIIMRMHRKTFRPRGRSTSVRMERFTAVILCWSEHIHSKNACYHKPQQQRKVRAFQRRKLRSSPGETRRTRLRSISTQISLEVQSHKKWLMYNSRTICATLRWPTRKAHATCSTSTSKSLLPPQQHFWRIFFFWKTSRKNRTLKLFGASKA